MVSAPAHCAYQTRLIKMADANHRPLGSVDTCNKRTINQFIHGCAEDLPAEHGYDRAGTGFQLEHDAQPHPRAAHGDLYLLELPEGQVVFHMCGEPTQTRHIVMHNEDAVISLLEHSQRRRHLELYVYLGNGRREHGV